LKHKISEALVQALTNLQNPFEVEINVDGYAKGAITEKGRLIFYHSKLFHGKILNYPTHDKELFSLVQE